MTQHISSITLVVPDYDEALRFYVDVLYFDLAEDTRLLRWVLVAPPGSVETRLLLAKAASPSQESRIGDQTGGRVFLFLGTDDFDRDHKKMVDRGVAFLEPPRVKNYGKVAVFSDPFGNKWDLIQHN